MRFFLVCSLIMAGFLLQQACEPAQGQPRSSQYGNQYEEEKDKRKGPNIGNIGGPAIVISIDTEGIATVQFVGEEDRAYQGYRWYEQERSSSRYASASKEKAQETAAASGTIQRTIQIGRIPGVKVGDKVYCEEKAGKWSCTKISK